MIGRHRLALDPIVKDLPVSVSPTKRTVAGEAEAKAVAWHERSRHAQSSSPRAQ